MLITRISPFTGKENSMEINVTHKQLEAWRNGLVIQKAMPNLSADEREFIKTGLTPQDWDTAFQDCD